MLALMYESSLFKILCKIFQCEILSENNFFIDNIFCLRIRVSSHVFYISELGYSIDPIKNSKIFSLPIKFDSS